MRLLFKLRANKSVVQKVFMAKYYNAMNSHIYQLLSKEETFRQLHAAKSFKGFCFGNLYPSREGEKREKIESTIKEGSLYNLAISSPIPKMIEALFFGIGDGEILNLGEGSFTVEEVWLKNFAVGRNDSLDTASIINLTTQVDGRIRSLLFSKSRQEYLDQLRKNLIRKHNALTKASVHEAFPLFDGVEVKLNRERIYAIPITFETGRQFNCFGEKLSFRFNSISDSQLAIFQTCFDAGFGERNSYGMGFMVVKGR